MAQIPGITQDDYHAHDNHSHYWNTERDDRDHALSPMTINGGKPVRCPSPFLWQLEPAHAVLYPLGMQLESQYMFVGRLNNNSR